jgi:lipid A 3-O-deacylase
LARIVAAVIAISTLALTMAQAGSACAQSGGAAGASFLTLQGENSSISSAGLTDRYYTNGLRLNYTSPERNDSMLSGIASALFGSPTVRLSLEISQQIYTPAATHVARPPANDEPYAGVLLANIAGVQDAGTTRSSFGVSLGMVGPSAMGEEVQNGFHDLIGQGKNLGWKTQLRDEAVFAVNIARVWRMQLANLGGLETDILPAVGLIAGTLRSAAEGGVNLRIGRSLTNDFGASRIRALAGGDVFAPGRELGWYVFAGVKGQAVMNDITLNGNTFQHSQGVSVTPLVGELDFGGAVTGDGFRVSYSQAVQTQTFRGQKGGAHQFGSLALTLLF